MKILLIIPGSGDSFYCGNCFRDNLYAQALRDAGNEVIIMPLYLPLTDKLFSADTPLFFPAISYYVAQKLFQKRKMPRFMEKILNSRKFLRMASSLSGTTSAKGMEQMTLSMIKGDDNPFNEQVGKIIDRISRDMPDIIHLSTSMLIGIAKAIKKHLNIPMVCSLQDEEIWLDNLEERYVQEAWNAIRENLKYVDRFVTSSKYYKEIMMRKFPEIAGIDIAYPGVNVERYASSDYPNDPTIAFFYRMNHENGLDILAQSFVNLKKEIPNLKLKIGGGYTRENKRFVRRIKKLLKPYMDDIIWFDNYSLNDHTAFYKDITLICAPLRFNEAFGLYLSEAFAAGRPAVVPNTGSFTEITEQAGILYHPNDSEHLTNALKKILTNPEIYENCKKQALHLSVDRYNYQMSEKALLKVYKEIVSE